MIDLAAESMTIKLDDELPAYPKMEAGIRRAPRREAKLSEADKALAIRNALRYIPPKYHVEMAKEFAEELNRNGLNATIRRRLGSDINASCGQLRLQKLSGESAETEEKTTQK